MLARVMGWNRGSLSNPVANSSEASGSSRIEPKVKQLQLNDSIFELHTPTGAPNLEFVFFHGLHVGTSNDQDPYLRTWESGDQTCIWPQTWLVDEFPGARMLFVSYQGCRETRDMYIVGENLASDMIEANIGQTRNCPVVLVGHCFGGLVLKQLCLQVNARKGLTKDEGERTKLEMFLNNIKRIFYYGTPHYGISMIDKVPNVLNDPLLSYFKTLSKDRSRLNSQFDDLCGVHGEWRTHALGESLPSESGLFEGVVVASEASARHGDFNLLAIDHTSICKPKSKTDMRFYALTNLVKSIESNIEDLPLSVHQCKGLPSYPADLERRAREVEEKLKGVFFLGLVGMGGIGKTTLAKQVFNNISRQFEYTCFVDNVKGIRSDALEKRLLSTFHHKGKSIGEKIDWWQLKGKQTLIVMDDLDSPIQLKLLEPQSFGINSHVIITTRDRGVMNSVGNVKIFDIYDVDFLQMDDAKKLFWQHAGIEQIRDDGLETNKVKEKVEAVIERCGGLPLTLEVMGSYLRDYAPNTVYWEQTVDKLKTGQSISGGENDNVWASLKISYDALAQEEQEMFTEAATLFFEQPLDLALAAWSSAYGNSETRWANLVRKSLAKEIMVRNGRYGEVYNSVWVHEQLRGLATSFNKGSRVDKVIWKTSEVVDLLNTEKVKAEAKFLRLFSWDRQMIQVDQLAKLTRLKYLKVQQCVLKGSAKKFPRELFILSLMNGRHRGFNRMAPIKLKEMNNLAVLEIKCYYIPGDFLEGLGNLDKLRILSLEDVKVINKLSISSLNCFTPSGVIRRLPETFCNLLQLKDLKLVGLELEELPESFGNLSALEHLTLCDVKCLKLPKSFVELAALQSLWLRSNSLGALPENFGRLSSLRKLHLYLSEVKNLPTSFGRLFALQSLKIECLSLQKLPNSFGNLSSLEDLYLRAYRLEALPENFARLNSLRRLELYSTISDLPNNFGELCRLQELRLDCCNLVKLPDRFGNLSSLKWLKLDTNRLESLPNSFGELFRMQDLTLGCSNLVKLPDNFGNLFSLKWLNLYTTSLESLPKSFGKLSRMQDLRLGCSNLAKLPDNFGNLSSLKRLELYTKRLESLPNSFGNLSSLQEFVIAERSVKCFPESVGQLSSLRKLRFGCDGIDFMPDGLAHLSFFSHSLTLTGNATQKLPRGLGVLSSLRTLSIERMISLESLREELGGLSSLQTLDISHCNSLESLPGSLESISSLKDVHLEGCYKLKRLPDSWEKPFSLKQVTFPQRDGRQDLTSSAVGESSSTTTDTDEMRIHLRECWSLEKSMETNSGWLLEQPGSYQRTYRRKRTVVDSTQVGLN